MLRKTALLAILVVISAISAAAQSPNYGSGFTASGLTLNGGAAISGTRLRVTDGGTSEARSAFYSTPVNVQQFTNTFTFQDTAGSSTADGLTFTIQNNAATALGGGGGSLGYGPTGGTTGGIPNSVAVKFDLYNNAGEGTDSTGLYTDGVAPTVPAVDMSSSGVDLHSGDIFSVTMSYNGTTLTMQITDTVTNATFSTSFTVNIPGVVGANTAFVGFTGGTGGLTATQDILSWTYTPTGGSPVPPTITTQPSNQTVSAGQTATFTVVASGTVPLTYQWMQNTGTGYSNISGANSASYTTPATTSANNGTTFEVTVTNGQGSATSNAATLTVTAAGTSPSYGSGFTASGLTLNGGAAISGTRLRLTDGGTGEGRSAFFNTPVNVQQFTNTFTFQPTNANADGFTFTIQNNSSTSLGGAGGSLGYGPTSGTTGGIPNSVAVKFDLYNNAGEGTDSTGLYTDGVAPTVPAVDMSSSGVDLHSGDTFSVTMSYNGTTLTMQITDTVTKATFSTSFTVNIPSVVGGSNAYVGFTGGTGGLTATQDILTWTYTPTGGSPVPPTITTQPSNQTVSAGQTATFTVVASGTAPLTYQWAQNTGTGFTNIGGATSASYTTPATTTANNGTTFEVTVTNGQGSVTSNPATLTVTTSAPTITTQPSNQTVTAGQTATFTVVANGTAPLTYQWMENTGTGYSNIGGATSGSYTTPATTTGNSGTTFEVKITNGQGSVTSNAATLTVTAAGSGPSYGSGFTSSGLTLNGGAAISGTRLRLTDGGNSEARSAFFNTAMNVQTFVNDFSFQQTNANADGVTFTIQSSSLTAVGGGGGSLGYGPTSGTTGGIPTSVAIGFQLYSAGNEVSLTGDWTNGASPAGTPGSDTTGSGVNLHSGDVMNVHMTYDGTTLTWKITDSVTGSSFTKSVTINIPSFTGNSAFVGFTGGTGGLTATQDILTWTFTPGSNSPVPPMIVTQPASQSVVVGQTATFSVVASGTAPLTYQWAQNTGSGFANISGATSASYTTPATTIANSGTTFEVTVTNGQGSVTSNVVTLTVTTAPTAPSYGSGLTSSALALNGGASITGARLRLTDGGSSEARSGFFNALVNVQSFTTTFTFQPTNANADGLTFTIQNNSPSALGGAGGSLGYGPTSGTTGGIANSVAVGFQLYTSSLGEVSLLGMWTKGASPAATPGTDMSGSGINLHSGDTFKVRINYNGSIMSVDVRDVTQDDINFTESFPINIPATVGSSTAYVGFTGADGGLTSTQDILSWSFSNSPTGTSGTFTYPVDSPAFVGLNDYSTYNGQYHTGLDLCPGTNGCVVGNPIYAAASGTIQAVQVTTDASQTMCDGSSTGSLPTENNNHLGNAIVIAHSNGKFSVYGHLDCVWPGIAPGVAVSQGQRIGNMGHSQYGVRSNSFTPHVHFEIKDAGTVEDPTGQGYSGFTPDLPDGYGYHDPRLYLFPITSSSMTPTAVKIVGSPLLNVLTGPDTSYSLLNTVSTGQEFVAFASSGSWYEIYLPNSQGALSGWIPASAGSQALASPDSTATKIQVGNTGGAGLLVNPGPSSSANFVSWVNNAGYVPFVQNCNPTAKIWDGQYYVTFANQSGWYEYYLPGNFYFSSGNACGAPSGPGPSSGWSSASFLSVVP